MELAGIRGVRCEEGKTLGLSMSQNSIVEIQGENYTSIN